MNNKYIDEFDKWLKVNIDSDCTRKTYLSNVKLFIKWCNSNKTKPDKEGIRKYIEHMILNKVNSSTISVRKHALMAFAKMKGFDIEPRSLKTPKIKRKMPTVLTEADRDKILAVIDDPTDLVQFMLMYDAALRVQELMNITVEDLKVKPGYLRVNVAKRGDGLIYEYAPLQHHTIEAANLYMKRRGITSGLLFPPPMTSERVRSMMRRLCKKAGVMPPDKRYYNPHSLRHGRAVQTLRGSEYRLNVVKKLLRHKSIQATEIYAHMSPEELKEVIPAPFPSLKTDNEE